MAQNDRYKSSLEKIQKKQRELESKAEGVFFKAKQGRNLIRILPADSRKGLLTFYYEYHQHYGLGKAGFTCNKTFEKPCLICRKAEQWSESDETKKQKIADSIHASERYAIAVGLVDEPDSAPKLFSVSNNLLGQLLQLYNDPDYQDFTDPEVGYDLILHRDGLLLATKYTLRPRRNPSKLKNKLWLKQRPDLTKIIKPYKKEDVIEALKLLLAGRADSED